MFKFSKEQETWDINGVNIGGQPGEQATAMIGSIFYEGSSVVEDSKKGKFDEEKARRLLEKEKEISESTGNPRIVDVVGGTSEALINYVDFIGSETESPFLIDGTTADVRLPVIEHVDEVGLADRAIYNTISIDSEEEEIEAIRNSGIKSAILLCFNPKNPTIEGRLESLEKVIELAKEAEIEKPLIDPSILDLPDPGPVAKTIYKIKKDHGLPCGCGAHNAVDQWNERVDMEKDIYTLRTAIANSFPISMGADFALYGPIEEAKEMYTACSLADAYVAYSMRLEEGMQPKDENHPINTIFRS